MRLNQYQAAGGVVLRAGRLLVLHKHARSEYVLPKGHVEAGETVEATALRETREETGYKNFRVLTSLGTGHVEFNRPDEAERVVRDETYFLLELLDEERDDAQDHDDAEHDRTAFELVWLTPAEAEARMTFDTGRTFVHRAVEWLKMNHRL